MENIIRFGENFIEMEFKPDWSKVKSLEEFLKSSIQLILYDNTKSDRISMAGVELIGVIVTFNLNNNLDKIIRFRLDNLIKDEKVTINIISETVKKELDKLISYIDNFMSSKNKKQLYLEKLKEYAIKDDEDSKDLELGLIRAIVEANAHIELKGCSNNSDLLCIKATFNVPRKL